MQSNHAEDVALLRQIANGQNAGIEALYDRYNRLVFSVALAMVGERTVAEEVTLDVFVQVWRAAATYDADRGNVRTWLIAITRHHAIDVLRWQRARLDSKSVYLDDLPLLDDADVPAVEEDAELAQQRDRVHEALGQLPPDQRAVLQLAYYKGYSQQQISDLLKQPLGTVKTRVRLAMQKLRKLLLKEDEPEFRETSENEKKTYR
jgi:RNA polymerase sigma-70 factor (ECF subfamily)